MLADDCRRNGTRGRLGTVLSQFLHDLLPQDAHERCNDKAFVSALLLTAATLILLVQYYLTCYLWKGGVTDIALCACRLL